MTRLKGSDVAAETVGVNVYRWKMLAFAISAVGAYTAAHHCPPLRDRTRTSVERNGVALLTLDGVTKISVAGALWTTAALLFDAVKNRYAIPKG